MPGFSTGQIPMALTKNTLYYGKDEPLPAQQELRAGPLSLIYEAGDLRYIRLGNHEILRRVYVAIRDQNWGTVPPVLFNTHTEIGSDSFNISYEVENKQGEIDFLWRGVISGDARGVITFRLEGEARATFRSNRIGFCVLHPAACAGAACRVEHADGVVEEGVLPVDIAPQLIIDGVVKPVQPFAELQTLTHQILPGLWAEVSFEGDIFELEDQRNWTDASYKTYAPPLRLPFPIEFKKGSKISQLIKLQLKGNNLPALRAESATGLTFALGSESAGPVPRIGLGVASHGLPLSNIELARLKRLQLSHLRVDLRLSEPDCADRLRQASSEATALGIALEVAIILSDAAEDELKSLARLLEQVAPPVWTWLIFHRAEATTTGPWVKLAQQYLAGYNPAAKIGAGTNIYFAELNRDRPHLNTLDLVNYSINPQAHAFDNASLVESLEAQAATVASAHRFCGNLPISVSPITLKPRFNPNAIGPEPEPAPGELPPQVDVRQMSLFGAGWTAGSLKYLAQSSVTSLTYYETTGWRGVMETEAGSPLPDKFHSLPGAVYPLYHVLADVGVFAAGQVIATASSNPLQVDGLAVHKNGKTRVLVANLSAKPRQVTVQNLAESVRLRFLDELNVMTAMQSPEDFRAQVGEPLSTPDGTLDLILLPYAVARIDF